MPDNKDTRREGVHPIVLWTCRIYSLTLLIFCITIVSSAIKNNQTKAAESNIPTGAAFCILWFLLIFLGVIEGGQGCLVGLVPVDKAKYEKTHPWTLKNTLLAHKGDNVERYIVGRQFNVFLIVFVINALIAGGLSTGKVFGFSTKFCQVFIGNNVALILFVIMVGQLAPQVNAASCMLDFINNPFMYCTTWFALLIEWSGMLHSVYFFQICFSKITKMPIESNEPPKTGLKLGFFWFQVTYSLFFLCGAMAVVFEGLRIEVTGMWKGTPVWASFIALFVLMIFVGLMEGMQIAAFAVLKVPEEEYKHTHKLAHANCTLMFRGKNLENFLVGRQIMVTACMFVVAKICTSDADAVKTRGENIFNVSDGLQSFFNYGFPGALMTTVIASLVWRVLAKNYSFAFMSVFVIYGIIWICLLLNWSGLCSASFLLGTCIKKAFRLKKDSHYIGETEAGKELHDTGDLEEGMDDELELVEDKAALEKAGDTTEVDIA